MILASHPLFIYPLLPSISSGEMINMLAFCLVRSSSTEPPSVGDPDPGSVVYIEKEGRSRGYGEALSSSNAPMESLALTSKQRRDKLSNKAQQDEEEERGDFILPSSLKNHPLIPFRNHQSLRW